MSRIMLCWELGGGAGHVRKLAYLGEALRQHGHEILMCSRDLAIAERVCAPRDIAVLQAPFWHPRADFTRLPQNFPEILAELGFYDTDFIRGLVNAWRQLFSRFNIDFVIGDYAPGAYLASRVSGVRAARMGTGFTCPPLTRPFPGIQLRRGSTLEDPEKIEQRMLDCVNSALKPLSVPAFQRLADTQATEKDYLATFAELDHYGMRKDETYFGVFDDGKSEVEPQWPAGEGPKVFVYYHPGYKHFEPLMAQLNKVNLPTLVVATGIQPALARKLVRKHINVCSRTVDLAQVAEHDPICINHGGHGAVAALLQQGCRLILVPMYNEQKILSVGLRKQDLALHPEKLDKLPDAINSIQDHDLLKRKVDAFARRYKKWTPKRNLDRLVDDINRRLEH